MELDRRGAELLFQVLTEREEKASVAIASNESFSGRPRPSPTPASAPPSSTASPLAATSSKSAPSPTASPRRAPPSSTRPRRRHAPHLPRHRRRELAETLQLIAGWLAADPATLGQSLLAYIGHPAYGIDTLRSDLDRFAFLLGGNDGEHLLGPGE
jgi:hypothetical protein